MSDYQQIQLRNRFNMTFTNGSSTEIARMDELDDGSLTFAGDMDESAKIFFEQVVKYNSLEIQTLEAKIKELEAQLEAYQKQALDELARMGQEIEQASKASVEDAIKYLKNKEYTTVHQDYALRWMEQYLSEQKES